MMFFVPLENFSSYGDITNAVEELKILTFLAPFGTEQ